MVVPQPVGDAIPICTLASDHIETPPSVQRISVWLVDAFAARARRRALAA